jgi:MFS family permease
MLILSERREAYLSRDLGTFLAVRFLAEAAMLAQSVSVGWTAYQLSRTPLSLGLIGLAEFVPMALFTLPAGELCDRVHPRRVLLAGLSLQALCAAGFIGLTRGTSGPLWQLYALLVVSGAARAFAEPAAQALLPFLVPLERLPRAIAWSSSLWQVATIVGPALGGLAYSFGPQAAYGACALSLLAAACGTWTLVCRPIPLPAGGGLDSRPVARVREGLRYVRAQPILFGAISLDLLAVLLGGATALLPVYARDILVVGPLGFGVLRSAPAIGACAMALYQVRHPAERNVGRKLFATVAVFGVATLVFAVSTSPSLSVAALIVVGASDVVSVNIRSSLVQMSTPDELRGRVAAVNMLFVCVSSELGAFESGLAATLIGTVPAVAAGGLGALVVAAFWIRLFPALWNADRLSRIA